MRSPKSVAVSFNRTDSSDVKLLDTGEGFKTLRTIASPLKLRNSITDGRGL
jgi:hypothetical protein